MVSRVLVGRTAEAEAVRAAYERRGTLLVSGEAGIGKSRLVASATRTLPGDPLVLTGGCLELGSAGAPYVPFVAILRDLVRRVGRDLLPRGETALGDWLPDLGPAPVRYSKTRLLEEMLTLVSRVAEQQPVVLVVEDLHWADASSRELFAYLARNLADAVVLLIGTVRTGELAAGHPNRQLLAEVGRRADVTRIDLGPLAPQHVAELLTAINGQSPDRARAERIHRRSGGNPLFVEALSDTDETPDGDLQALLLDRITDLAQPARAVLSTMAVAGAALTDESLSEVSAIPESDLHGALAELVGRDLVVVGPDGYQIRHDLIREAVYASMLPGRRRQIHAQYATAITATDSVALAEHWLAAGQIDRALPVAWRAAQSAARQNAYDEQLYMLELILLRWAEVPNPVELIGADRTAVLEHAAAAAFAAGRASSGITHSTAALSGLDDPLRVAGLLGLRGQLRNRADGTGWEDIERAIDLVPPGSSDALRSRLLSALAFIGISAHRHEHSRRHATEALRIAEHLADDSLKAPALLVLAALDDTTGQPEQAKQRFAEARRLAGLVGDEHTLLTTFQWEASLAESSGRYEEAIDLAHHGQQAAERLGWTRSRGSMLASARANSLRLLGRWAQAEEIIDAALADNPPALYAAFLRLVAADIARCRGAVDQFEVLLRQLTEFARHTTGAAEAKTEIAVQRIAWAVEQGDPESADHVLGAHLSAVLPPQEGMRLVLFGARVQRARKAAAPRNRQIAEQVEARLAQLADVLDSLPGTGPVFAAHRLTFQAATLSECDRAVAAWRDLGNRHETGLVLTEAAAIALASNNRPGAQSRLGEARAIAADLGAAPLLARIDDLVARGRLTTNTPARNEFGLTARELDVLRKLTGGQSNSQIAAELFISTNTVATHVARILAKLDVTSRTEAVSKAHAASLV